MPNFVRRMWLCSIVAFWGRPAAGELGVPAKEGRPFFMRRPADGDAAAWAKKILDSTSGIA